MKALSLNSHCWFLDQMNLINIQDHLQDYQAQEAVTTFELSKLMNIDWILWLNHQYLHEKFWVWMRFYSQIWHEFSELNWALLLWFWFYLTLFWSNLTSIRMFSLLNLHFEFLKKSLNLVRIQQPNLNWLFYVEEVFFERLWFYFDLF